MSDDSDIPPLSSLFLLPVWCFGIVELPPLPAPPAPSSCRSARRALILVFLVPGCLAATSLSSFSSLELDGETRRGSKPLGLLGCEKRRLGGIVGSPSQHPPSSAIMPLYNTHPRSLPPLLPSSSTMSSSCGLW
ncbi:hypothetical protein B0T21DRAFT_58373 [Apiosordaria backusii]|uniref:Uncharacterized protein n=1 Tax=Apiosordaria backusii TaxID=314023 RepID=A0AA40AN45_9PEZI|nr:hypothetical protein B0T21DRAFT_58373 [Apiosordaria backusii]